MQQTSDDSGQPIIAPPENYPELLAELLTMLALELRQAGLDVTSANDIAWRTVERVRDSWGGQVIYIPSGNRFDSVKRYEAMWQAFDGRNHAELARKFGVSEQTVYNAISLMRKRAQFKLDLG